MINAVSLFYVLQRWCVSYFKPGFHIGVTTNNGVEALNNSLKQFYLKLTGSGTLASLVDTLVHEFVPDHIMTYTRLNYMYSSQYKRYNEEVPAYLHNMPRTVVKHCLLKIAASSAFQKEDIEILSGGLFSVKSETSPTLRYAVDLGALDRSPSCSCPSFTPSYLPCKHIFAVFEHTEYTWGDLSTLYRSSPYMNLDVDFLSDGAISQLGTDNKTHNPPVLLSTNSEVEESSDCDTGQLEATRKDLRESLKLLNDMSFLANDAAVLAEVNDIIVRLIDIVKRTAARENHLLLHQGQTTKRPVSTRQARQLPVRKKRKKKLKRQYSRLSISGIYLSMGINVDHHHHCH